jgi:hypothetical protein
VGTRTSARADFEDFVAVCSGRLSRTASLLTGDVTAAEPLLEAALARVWSRWERLEAPPEQAVRSLLVEATTRWWGRRVPAVAGDGPWARWTRLGRRERAVVVLRLVDGLDEADTAVVVGCPQRAVAPTLEAALERLGTRDPVPWLTDRAAQVSDQVTDQVRDQVADQVAAEQGSRVAAGSAARAAGTDVRDLRARLARVDEEASALRRHRRVRSLLATTLAVVAGVTAVSVIPRMGPDGGTPLPARPTPTLPSERPQVRPPRLLDRQLPSRILARQVLYVYLLSEESPRGASVFRATVAPATEPQALAWIAPRGQPGRVVVHVDGTLIMSSPTGGLVTGLVLAPNRPHEVVLRTTRPGPDVRLGLAIYRWPQP